MKYCTRCLYPANHPLHLTFDELGVCSGCRVHEEKDRLNWLEREKKLKTLLHYFRNTSRRNYDCVVPVSGARDSYFILHTIKRKFGMNPLLVTYNKHYNTALGIHNLAYLRTIFDCDLLTLTVSPLTVKKITRVTLQKRGSIYWHCLAGQTAFPVQIAVKYKIPLIIWGVHQGCDQVGMFSHLDEVEMTRKYRQEHDLMNLEAEDLISPTDYLSKEELIPYVYPHDKEIERVGVRGIYLSNYLRWDSKAQHEQMIKLYGYQTSRQTRTFDTYNDVDCYHYSDLHDYIKFLKYGYGKVTDHACREIRLKRLTRQEGIRLVNKYQHRRPQTLRLFLDWLNLSESGFYYFINQFRDPQIWKKVDNQYKLRDQISNHFDDSGVAKVKLKKQENCRFFVNNQTKKPAEKYILIGKGYP